MFEQHMKWDLVKNFLNGFCLYIGFPCTYRPQNHSHRLAFASVVFGGIIFFTLLSTMVVKLVTSPFYEVQIETYNEILDKNFELIGSRHTLNEMLKQNEVVFSLNIEIIEMSMI